MKRLVLHLVTLFVVVVIVLDAHNPITTAGLRSVQIHLLLSRQLSQPIPNVLRTAGLDSALNTWTCPALPRLRA